MLRLLIGAMIMAMAAGCAARKRDRYFVQIAEGLTSPTITEGIRVAPRMFSAPALVAACKEIKVVERLEVAPETLELTLGTRYSLNTLTVVAVNAADIAIPATPIVLEVEDTEPPVLQVRSDDPDLDAGRIRAVGAGEFRMRVRTICGTPYVETLIKGRVQ